MKNKKLKAGRLPHSFCGAEEDFDKAEIAIIPVPYDSTTTYVSGTRSGPHAIINASKNLDEPWGEQEMHPIIKNKFIYTFDEVIPEGGSTRAHLESVYNFILEEVVPHNKAPFLLGGEHSLTYAPVKALHTVHKNFSILQIDAHTDLRDSYNKERFSHSCVMRRCIELGKGITLTSIGIRSVDRDVRTYIDKKYRRKNNNINIFFGNEIPTHYIASTLQKEVYITFDLDGLDPSIMPAVGTPQPGGFLWDPIVKFLRTIIRAHTIIGMDIVELAPIPGNVVSDITAAKLLWHMIQFYYDSKYYTPAKIR